MSCAHAGLCRRVDKVSLGRTSCWSLFAADVTLQAAWGTKLTDRAIYVPNVSAWSAKVLGGHRGASELWLRWGHTSLRYRGVPDCVARQRGQPSCMRTTSHGIGWLTIPLMLWCLVGAHPPLAQTSLAAL